MNPSADSASENVLPMAASGHDLKTPSTPTRPSSTIQGIKSPWWQCLSPLDPGLAITKSPNMPIFQRAIGVEESPSAQSPLYSRTHVSPNTLKRALESSAVLQDPVSSLAQEISEELNSYERNRKRRYMQKLDFSGKIVDTKQTLAITLDGPSAESIPPQHPLRWSPRKSANNKRKAAWSSIHRSAAVASSLPNHNAAYKLTPSSPPFDPAVPASASVDLEATCPIPRPPSSTGGEPARTASYSPTFVASRRTTSRSGGRPRAPDTTSENNNHKPCNCKKSKCLKLYCECFARQGYCTNCNCVGCNNIPEFEEVRQKAIVVTLERDPNAFFRANLSGKVKTKTRRGCHCKKSECLKKYCECFQAGVSCSDICKCTDCRNGKEHSHDTPRTKTKTIVRNKKDTIRSRSIRVPGR